MASTRLDMSVFVSLISLGGAELRDQLLVDLRQFEAELETYCLTRPEDMTGSAGHLGAVLHNLRGLGATIGANTLVHLCQQLDTASPPCVSAAHDHAARLTGVARVIEEIAHVRTQIEARCGVCP